MGIQCSIHWNSMVVHFSQWITLELCFKRCYEPYVGWRKLLARRQLNLCLILVRSYLVPRYGMAILPQTHLCLQMVDQSDQYHLFNMDHF